MHKPKEALDFALKETSSNISASVVMRDKLSCTYDLVEQMHYLYARMVKAKDLLWKDVTGGVDPDVEVKLGNYKGLTNHFEKKSNPQWNQVFCLLQRIQASVLEVVIKDNDAIVEDFVGRVMFD